MDNGGSYQSVPSESTQKSPEFELFRRGREVLGPKAGSLKPKIKRFRGTAQGRALIEIAATKNNPTEYVCRVLNGAKTDEEPIVVQEARRDGIYFERLGPTRWKVATTIYDERGREVGF